MFGDQAVFRTFIQEPPEGAGLGEVVAVVVVPAVRPEGPPSSGQ